MQRPAGGVRVAVAALCRLLSAVGVVRVPSAESFRRAKLNTAGAQLEEEFWNLLFNILCKAEVISCGAQEEETQGFSTRGQQCVAAGLWQSGYVAEWIVSGQEKKRPGEEEEEEGEMSRGRPVVSSRDLLLALGWILGNGVLDAVMNYTLLHIDTSVVKLSAQVLHREDLLPGEQSGEARRLHREDILSQEQSGEARSLHREDLLSQEQSGEARSLHREDLRRLQWLLGALRFNSSTLVSMTEERAALLHHVILSSSSSSVLHHNNSSTLRKQCVAEQQVCDLLESYMKWKQHEQLFWKWMDSVLDCYLTDRGEACPAAVQPGQPANRSTAVCHHGNRGLERLDMALRSLPLPSAQREGDKERRRAEEEETAAPPALLQAYRARLQSQRPARHPSCPAQRPRDGAAALGQPQASRSTTYPGQRPSAGAAAPGQPQASRSTTSYSYPAQRPPPGAAAPGELQASRSTTSYSYPAQRPPPGAAAPGELQASRALRLLRQTEAHLRDMTDRRRRANRTRLQDMIGRLEHVVLIPP